MSMLTEPRFFAPLQMLGYYHARLSARLNRRPCPGYQLGVYAIFSRMIDAWVCGLTHKGKAHIRMYLGLKAGIGLLG